MSYDWYKIINLDDFEATGLVSRELTLILEGIGSKTFLVTKGNLVSLTIDDSMLPVEMLGDNPYVFNERAVYLDANRDIWYGVPSA